MYYVQWSSHKTVIVIFSRNFAGKKVNRVIYLKSWKKEKKKKTVNREYIMLESCYLEWERFPGKFITTKPTLQESRKEILQTEMKSYELNVK